MLLSRRTIGFIAIGILSLFLLIIFTTSHPLRKAPADKIAISYGGGLFEGAQFQGVTNPSSGLVINGMYDKWYEYPVTQRNYILNDAGDGDEVAGGISAPDKDGVAEYIELTITFKLNTSKLRDFHEKIGMKYQAYTDKGWKQMLTENFRPSINNAVQQTIRQYTTDEIRVNSNIIPDLQDAIKNTLKKDVTKQLGAEYFCGPNYKLNSKECPNFEVSIKSVTPPQSILQTYTDQKTSANEVIVAQNKAAAAIEKAKGENASKQELTPALTPEYLKYLSIQALSDCAKNVSCTLIYTGGQDFNVNVK